MIPSINPSPNTRKRVDWWIKTSIHVKGKPEWIIIKTHTHGAIENDVILGKPFENLIGYMEERYNDGINFKIHYVTARELYNIIKAVEAGETGEDPELYRNYLISAPNYSDSIDCAEGSDELKQLIAKSYQ